MTSSAPSSPRDEALCPECATPLALLAPGEATCPAGHGRALALDVARRRLPAEAHPMLDWVVKRAPLAHRPCPVCREPMGQAELPLRLPGRAMFPWGIPTPSRRLELAACPSCAVVWLDALALGALQS